MKQTLTTEQLEALRLFAAANGRLWKSKLNALWMNGRYSQAVLGKANPALLQQVRNTCGPSWLVRFSLKAAAAAAPAVNVQGKIVVEYHGLEGWLVMFPNGQVKSYRAKTNVIRAAHEYFAGTADPAAVNAGLIEWRGVPAAPAAYKCDDCGAAMTADHRLCDDCYQAEVESDDETYRARWEEGE